MDFEKELEKLLNAPVSKPEEAMEEMTPERLIELQHETIILQMKLIEKLSSRRKRLNKPAYFFFLSK